MMAVFRPIGISSSLSSMAFARQSSKISLGISFKAIDIPRGTKIKSSIYPKIGMKSGTRSIGEKAYPITNPKNNRFHQETRESLYTR